MWKTCLAALLLTLLAGTSLSAAESSLEGEVVVRSIDDTRVAVFIDTDADKILDQGFLLTTDIPLQRLRVRFASARVSFTEGYVRVSSGRKIYDLQVAGFPDSPETPPDMDVVTVIGSALQHSRGKSGCDVTRALKFDVGSCYSYGSE